MRRLGLRLSAYGIKDKGTWQKNTQYKAEFIRDQIADRKHGTVWIDSDAIIWKRPELFDHPPIDNPDFMAAWTATNSLTGINAACLYWGGTDKAREIADRWVEKVRENPRARFADQTPLDQVIKEVIKEGGAKTIKLPPSYSYIFDKTDKSCRNIKFEDIVIEQFQVSRWFKNLRAKD
tara:strand:- start:76 stop:609 length:534 start_codon:yes stop_codon:yes gene_type:complete